MHLARGIAVRFPRAAAPLAAAVAILLLLAPVAGAPLTVSATVAVFTVVSRFWMVTSMVGLTESTVALAAGLRLATAGRWTPASGTGTKAR